MKASLFSLIFLTTIKSEGLFARELSARDQFRVKAEKMTHLRFHLHDTVTEQHPTAIPVALKAFGNCQLEISYATKDLSPIIGAKKLYICLLTMTLLDVLLVTIISLTL